MHAATAPEPSDWERFLIQFPLLTRLIRSQLDGLKLNKKCTIDDIKHDVFIELKKSVNNRKLDCQVIEGKLFLTRIKQDGTRVPINNLTGYLRVLVYNHLLKKYVDIPCAHVDIENLPQQTKTPEDYAQTQELKSKIQQLDPEDALILELCWFEDISCNQIAERLVSKGFPCYSESTVRKKHQRAREKLRAIY